MACIRTSPGVDETAPVVNRPFHPGVGVADLHADAGQPLAQRIPPGHAHATAPRPGVVGGRRETGPQVLRGRVIFELKIF
jgi:hypothetical protein